MKNNTKLILGISLPFLVILFVIGFAVFPKLFFDPKYDFVYIIDSYCKNTNYNNCYGGDYNSWSAYKVVNGKIEKETSTAFGNVYNSVKGAYDKVAIDVIYPTLYRYNVTNDSFTEISFKQAQELNLTGSGSSPDGTVISSDRRGGGGLIGEVLIGGGDYNRYGLYMKNGSFSKKITIQNGVQQDYYYSLNNFRLIGWVK